MTDDRYIKTLFKADALIMDTWSSKFLQLYREGYKKEEIIKMLKDEFTES